MSKYERIRFTLNLDKPEHAQVLEQLQKYSGKKRSEYVVECILAAVDAEHLEKLIGKVLDERLKSGQLSALPTSDTEPIAHKNEIPASMLKLLDEF